MRIPALMLVLSFMILVPCLELFAAACWLRRLLPTQRRSWVDLIRGWNFFLIFFPGGELPPMASRRFTVCGCLRVLGTWLWLGFGPNRVGGSARQVPGEVRGRRGEAPREDGLEG